MSLSYEPLWEMLNELDISKMEFAKIIGISNATLAKLGKNEPITLTIVDKICTEFDCRIENVVQYIPDLLLKQKKSSFELEIGDIILVNFSSSHEKETTNPSFKPCVILEVREEIINKTPTWQYIIAPLVTVPSHYLTLFYENVFIENKLAHGWISLDLIENISSEQILKIIGKMPDGIIKKLKKFLSSINELFDEDE